ncbi:MAG: DUF2178 domain-containing protein [Patescibacteria group bacterium]|jgi:uncharacterized membrane protein
MTLKQFQTIKLVTVVILAIIFSRSIIYENYLVPVVVLVISTLVLWYLRRYVKEVIADERDWQTAGKAASLAIQIYAWFAVIVMIVLYAQRDLNPSYLPIAATLAYSTCFLMLLYALIFRYYHKFSLSNKKTFYLIAIILAIAVLAVFGLRLFSGEDDWICVDGQWVEHGHPDFPAPDQQCQ